MTDHDSMRLAKEALTTDQMVITAANIAAAFTPDPDTDYTDDLAKVRVLFVQSRTSLNDTNKVVRRCLAGLAQFIPIYGSLCFFVTFASPYPWWVGTAGFPSLMSTIIAVVFAIKAYRVPAYDAPEFIIPDTLWHWYLAVTLNYYAWQVKCRNVQRMFMCAIFGGFLAPLLLLMLLR